MAYWFSALLVDRFSAAAAAEGNHTLQAASASRKVMVNTGCFDPAFILDLRDAYTYMTMNNKSSKNIKL